MSEPESRAIQSLYFQCNVHHPSPSNVTYAAADLRSNNLVSVSWPSVLPLAVSITPRQLHALHEGWKSWWWDSSEEEFPEENRLIQSIKKLHQTLHSFFLSHCSCSMELQQSLALQKSPQDYEPHQGHSSAWVVSYRRAVHHSQTATDKILIHKQTYLNVSSYSVK